MEERFELDVELRRFCRRICGNRGGRDRGLPRGAAQGPDEIVVSVRELGLTCEPGGGVRLSVTDEGPGIGPAEHANLFQRFSRGPMTAKRTHGLGLGLYICRAIAEAHGGAVGVDSTPGAGATFWIDLPTTTR